MSSIDLMYQHEHEVKESKRSVSSTLTVDKKAVIISTQSGTKEERMKRSINFKVNLKQRWVVGLFVLISLGLCGVFPTRSNATSKLHG